MAIPQNTRTVRGAIAYFKSAIPGRCEGRADALRQITEAKRPLVTAKRLAKHRSNTIGAVPEEDWVEEDGIAEKPKAKASIMYRLPLNSRLCHPQTYVKPVVTKAKSNPLPENKLLSVVYADPSVRKGLNCVGDLLVGEPESKQDDGPKYKDRWGFVHREPAGDRERVT